MANLLKDLLGGGSKSSASPIPSADSDFADFAEAADPSPAFTTPLGGATLEANVPAATNPPYTKWYRLDERYTLADFRAEGIILVCIVFIFTLHVVGSRLNRSKARKWVKAHSKTLASEFALVGFGSSPTSGGSGDGETDFLVADLAEPEKALKEKSLFEFATYATGRQNIAFMDAKLSLIRRFNPLVSIAEWALSLFFDSFPTPQDTVEAAIYPFDGKEALTVPGVPGAAELKTQNTKSTYDGFVWAIVNKERMKQVRDERFDVSLTFTKDNSKLPIWLTVMSESAEITKVLLTDELAKAAESAGDLFEYLIVSDQPVDKPKTLDETTPRKRIFLKYRLPSDNNYEPLLPIFQHFIRIADQLVKEAHFRPEVLKKVRSVREDVAKQIQRADLEEKSEERNFEREKARKAKRDQELSQLDAKGQKKYLEREREKELRKQQKKMTSRG
ncbi:hypothetical protein INS49_005663 [Diaporthe citri]|uniref:uncharacterized protein n=1 Tax=Diaporthe citri TaxID=83186 RepID=UPI001C821383|nr:uncharacterized protein INS49_005663 [Diaporthe citri]KAG6353482.1 hypothetical protein INS49_005663 [Diaporthe citri]